MPTIFLLHGALGDSHQFETLSALLTPAFNVHCFNFSGHGGQPFENEFSIAKFAQELIEQIESLPHDQQPVSVFGYSMGGYVAAYAAMHRPELFHRIVTHATKWFWDEPTAAKECTMLDAQIIQTKLPGFAWLLTNRHAPNNWKDVLHRTAEMLTAMGQRPPIDVVAAASLQVPVLLLAGDRDKTVTVEETLAVYRQWPHASFGVLPGTSHPVETVDKELLAKLITTFAGK